MAADRSVTSSDANNWAWGALTDADFRGFDGASSDPTTSGFADAGALMSSNSSPGGSGDIGTVIAPPLAGTADGSLVPNAAPVAPISRLGLSGQGPADFGAATQHHAAALTQTPPDEKPDVVGGSDLTAASGGPVDGSMMSSPASSANSGNAPKLGTFAPVSAEQAPGLMSSLTATGDDGSLAPANAAPDSSFTGQTDNPGGYHGLGSNSANPVPAGANISFNVSTPGSGLVFDNTITGTYTGSNETYFENDIIAAETILEKQATNSFTITVELDGANQGNNGDGADNNSLVYGSYTYAQLKTALAAKEQGNPIGQIALQHFPATDPSGGAGFYLPTAYARFLGLSTASGGTEISSSNQYEFNSSYPYDSGVILNTYYITDLNGGQDAIDALTHELSETEMGRVGGLGAQDIGNTPYWTTMDLFRYTAAGVYDTSNGKDSQGAYFSYNGGQTTSQSASLAFFNNYTQGVYTGGDNDDFTFTAQESAPTSTNPASVEDIFGPVSTVPGLSLTDDQILEALGWDPGDTTPPALVHDSPLAITVGQTLTIPSSLLQYTDNVSSDAQETYSIVTLPADGTLLKNGSAVTASTTFTQADIDNGLISYHETASGASSDSFVFKVTDAAGNTTTAGQFQFSISPPPDTTPPSLVHDGTLAITAGQTLTIPSSLLQYTDNVSSDAQETYSIITLPGDGMLLKNGAAVTASTTFTQADIDNGLIGYHETANGATSDSFVFKVTDAAGNSTTPQQFGFSISGSPPAPSGLTLSAASDSGIQGDDITDVKTPIIVGVGAAGDTVTLAQGSIVLGSATVAANGMWQITTFPLTLGAHSVTATETDGLGNVSAASAPLSLAIVQSPATSDVNGDGMSDLLFQNTNGLLGIWEMSGLNIIGSGVPPDPGPSWDAIGTGDFNGDGKSDILLQNSDGTVGVWEMSGFNTIGTGVVEDPGPTWKVIGTGDFNGDGMSDIVLQNTDGTVGIWEMSGLSMIAAGVVEDPGPTWKVIGTGDFNGDGMSDIVLQNTDGTVGIWEMSGLSMIGAGIVENPGPTWKVIGTGDFNGDGKSDILLQNSDGTVGIWLMNGTSMIGSGIVQNPGTSWHAIGTGDFNGDGKSDILLQNSDGGIGIWEMDGLNIIASGSPQMNFHFLT